MIARGPMVLCAHPSRPYRTLPELVAAAKAQARHADLRHHGARQQRPHHRRRDVQLTGIRLVHVPYRGAAPLLNDGTAGHVDMVISSSATVAPQVESGQLRALIQFGEKRASFIPDTRDRGRAGHHLRCAPIRGSGSSGRPGRRSRSSTGSTRTWSRRCARRRPTASSSTSSGSRCRCPTPEDLRKSIAEGLPFWAKIIRDNNIKGGAG